MAEEDTLEAERTAGADVESLFDSALDDPSFDPNAPASGGKQAADTAAVAQLDPAAEAAKSKAEEQTRQQEATQAKTYPDSVKGESARANFDKLKTERDTALRESQTWKQKHDEIVAKNGSANPEYQKAQAERDAAIKERDEFKKLAEERGRVVALKAIEETDDFREKVTKPRQEAAQEVAAMVKAYDLDATKINEISKMPDRHSRWKAIREYCEESGADAQELKIQIEKYIGTHEQEHALREEQKGNLEFATRSQQEKEAASRLKSSDEWKKGHEEAKTHFESKMPRTLAAEGMKPLWDKAVADAAAYDPDSYNSLSSKHRQFHNIMGFFAPPAIAHLRKQLDTANATITARNGARQTGGSGAVDTENPGDKVDPSDPFGSLIDKLSGVGSR